MITASFAVANGTRRLECRERTEFFYASDRLLTAFCFFVLASRRFIQKRALATAVVGEACAGQHGSEVFALFLRVPFSLNRFSRLTLFAVASVMIVSSTARAQQTNPVDRKVTNPMTDTPNVNPLTQEQPPVRQRVAPRPGAPQATDQVTVDAQKATEIGREKENRIVVYEGNVDIHVGTYRLQADKVTDYEATNKIVAEGNVVFDQGDMQRITGSRAEWNYRTKTGFFVDSTGFTNQTEDGTRLYFTADRIERISLDTIVALNAQITACDEEVPKWSFYAKRVRIKTGDRARLVSAKFKVKHFPILYLPYASISIKHRDRASGFLTPTFGGSGAKGFRVSEAYYLTLGRSADITFRGDIYTQRGFGFGTDLRTRANSRSFFNAGFFYVKDRVLGSRADAAHPDQGGSSFYVDGVHYFPNGFVAAADVNVTSNLALDRKSTRLNSSHSRASRMPSSA